VAVSRRCAATGTCRRHALEEGQIRDQSTPSARRASTGRADAHRRPARMEQIPPKFLEFILLVRKNNGELQSRKGKGVATSAVGTPPRSTWPARGHVRRPIGSGAVCQPDRICGLRWATSQSRSGQRAWYVELLGQDQVHRHCHGFGFSGSIDLAKALSAEVVLTTELNGAPVPQVHGFPPRAVVLGWIGARSVNGWADHAIGGALLKVFSQQRIGSSGRSARTRRATSHKGAALSEAPIVTVDPAPDLVVRRAECPYAGRPWALGSAGHCGPDVCHRRTDWQRAQILTGAAAPWTWASCEAVLNLAPGHHTLAARATDGTGATQPRTVSATWNVK
jgi:hypothetical protein